MISSNIKSVGYDRSTGTLEIEFSSGKVYQYEGVPPDLPEKMMKADSVGQFFARAVKPVFQGKLVDA